MSSEKDRESPETLAKTKRISLRRETVRLLGVRSGVRTGGCAVGGTQVCQVISCLRTEDDPSITKIHTQI